MSEGQTENYYLYVGIPMTRARDLAVDRLRRYVRLYSLVHATKLFINTKQHLPRRFSGSAGIPPHTIPRSPSTMRSTSGASPSSTSCGPGRPCCIRGAWRSRAGRIPSAPRSCWTTWTSRPRASPGFLRSGCTSMGSVRCIIMRARRR